MSITCIPTHTEINCFFTSFICRFVIGIPVGKNKLNCEPSL